MDTRKMRQIFLDTDFVHRSGTPEELQVANYLKEQCEALGVPARLEAFPVAMAEIETARVEADGREIPVYDADAATRKDKYTVFFGGNYGTVTVTGGAGNGKCAVIVKDSFANGLAPLLTADYETVIMIDPRYFAGSFDSVVAAHPGCDLIFLFEISGLCENGDLAKLLM